jgi:hypothetical protein
MAIKTGFTLRPCLPLPHLKQEPALKIACAIAGGNDLLTILAAGPPGNEVEISHIRMR